MNSSPRGARVGDLSKEHEQILFEFKQALQVIVEKKQKLIDATHLTVLDDRKYLRFLRARNFELKASLDMLVETLEWRTSFKVEEITIKDVVKEYLTGKVYFHKKDVKNRIVAIIKVCLHHPKESDPMECKKLCVWFMEEGLRRTEPGIETCCLIFDMTNFSLSNMDYGFVTFLLKIFSHYYPESLGECLIFNSPLIFWGCWKIISPWVDPVTRAKVKFVAKKDMTQFISKENLLVEYGGEDTYVHDPSKSLKVMLQERQTEKTVGSATTELPTNDIKSTL